MTALSAYFQRPQPSKSHSGNPIPTQCQTNRNRLPAVMAAAELASSTTLEFAYYLLGIAAEHPQRCG